MGAGKPRKWRPCARVTSADPRIRRLALRRLRRMNAELRTHKSASKGGQALPCDAALVHLRGCFPGWEGQAGRLDDRSFVLLSGFQGVNYTSTTVPMWQIDCEELARRGRLFELRDVSDEEHFQFVQGWARRNGWSHSRSQTTVTFHPPEMHAEGS